MFCLLTSVLLSCFIIERCVDVCCWENSVMILFALYLFIFQVEKAFREGTARQNAHSIFVCLALKLLEERVHVACKEIITLEKQVGKILS